MSAEVTAAAPVGAVLLGVPGFVVLAAGVVGGELELLVETTGDLTGCPVCGQIATAHGRRPHLVRDVPVGGRPVAMMWAKRLWRCDEPKCPQRTWSETSPAIRRRASLTARAERWCLEQGRSGWAQCGLGAPPAGCRRLGEGDEEGKRAR